MFPGLMLCTYCCGSTIPSLIDESLFEFLVMVVVVFPELKLVTWEEESTKFWSRPTWVILNCPVDD